MSLQGGWTENQAQLQSGKVTNEWDTVTSMNIILYRSTMAEIEEGRLCPCARYSTQIYH